MRRPVGGGAASYAGSTVGPWLGFIMSALDGQEAHPQVLRLTLGRKAEVEQERTRDQG